MAHERVPLNVIRRQLGHVKLGVTSVYLDRIDTAEMIDAVGSRAASMQRLRREALRAADQIDHPRERLVQVPGR